MNGLEGRDHLWNFDVNSRLIVTRILEMCKDWVQQDEKEPGFCESVTGPHGSTNPRNAL
jgi:hypothetical protein